MDPKEQTAIDNKMKELDGTDNKAKLGANAILAVSLAVAKVCASSPWKLRTHSYVKLSFYLLSCTPSNMPAESMILLGAAIAHAANMKSL